MSVPVSVIICTHNPRPAYLSRVLDALKAQTLSTDEWELLLVDNASREQLNKSVDLSWHSQARHVCEEEIGLTPARLRGIKESVGDLLVFVDDDNVLASDYLAAAATLASTHFHLGVFGAGSISGEYEISPPPWLTPYLEGLVICKMQRDYWSNLGGWSEAMPYGAGLCVRRPIAQYYFEQTRTNPLRKMLGRSGANLGAGEDTDLALCAVDLGLGTGRFCSLRLTHLIQKSRLTEEYIIRLYAGFAGAGVIAAVLRPNPRNARKALWKRQARFWFDFIQATRLQRKIMIASARARKQAIQMISKYSDNQPVSTTL